ncbi:hypothetical protein [Nitrosovibrio tenuis]|uniref:Uncharacterized protein n=1 Tax=Nitrosovibrio tenuis TaxID=1233 RepID=A0A1H7RUU9_9PROT|nr:hypothetical protein [Nitrosovibrio tenuis]SEL63966.1 hypothetical protein SAMN05216387_12018 [Nitrosovibrio tenuis]
MSYFRQFDNFDPYNGEVQSYPFDLLPAIATRARNLLSKPREQLIQIAETADWIVEEYFHNAREKYFHELLTEGGWELQEVPEEGRTEAAIRKFMENGFPGITNDPGSLFDNAGNTSVVTALKAAISNYSLDGSDLAGTEEYEFFAVLALWLIADCLMWVQLEPKYLALGGNAAIEAMDAVCYAEYLQGTDQFVACIRGQVSKIEDDSGLRAEEEVQKKLKQRISLASKEAANKRHRKSAELRAMARHLFLSGNWQSVRQASKRIFPQLVEHGHRIGFAFSPERGEQTVYEWLLKVSKQNPRAGRRITSPSSR